MKQFDLVGINGNAFSIIGYVINAMKHCHFSNADISDYQLEAMSSDYTNLIIVSTNMIDKCNSQVLDLDEIRNKLDAWFSESCNENCYDSYSQWEEDMLAMIDHANDFILEDALDFLNNFFNKTLVSKYRAEVEDILSNLADEILNG